MLILASTVTGAESSIEAQEAVADGYGVDIVDDATWSAMTADQFAAYRAIVLGDPTCQGEPAVAAAEANARVWGPVINGNIEIFGSDPVFHATFTDSAIAAVTQRAVDFAVGQQGRTGAYISLSCYFEGTAGQTHVSLLDGLDAGGTGFSVHGVGCSDGIHIEASSPALTGINDELLSNWSCSVHEAFDSWPAKFGVLAVDTDSGSIYRGQDGTTGDPYILAFPGGGFQGATESAGGGSPTGHTNQCQFGGWPVNCATGEFWHTFSDLAVPGRGPALDLARTYSSARAAIDGPFGFGWTSAYSMSVAVDAASGAAQVTQENGATTVFTSTAGGYAAPPRVFATLTKNPDGSWTFIRHQRQRFAFDAGGRLTAISDLNGYTTVVGYDATGHLASVSDPAGRTLTVASDSAGRVTRVTDPAGRSVSYGYDGSGNLTSAIDVAGGAWSFGYDATTHLMTTMTDPRGGIIRNTYDATGRTISQTDAAGRVTSFAYSDSGATITDPNGNITVEDYTQGQLVALTKGAGTPAAATWRYSYDPATLGLTKTTDPNGHVSTATYDGGSYNPTSTTNALAQTTTVSYNTFEEPLTVTDPLGTDTTYTYDATGNVQSVSRPLTGTSTTQVTRFTYADSVHPGDVTAAIDPVGKTRQFSYDPAGDLTAATDPLGNKTTYGYDSIGRRTTVVSPRGNASGASAAAFTTTTSYDAFGDVIRTSDPLGHVTTAAYDANRNRTGLTDANGRATAYSYDPDNELIKVARADGSSLAYAYDKNGNQTAQADAAGHVTSYGYDPVDRVASSTDPLNRTTTYAYDGAGNRTSLRDPAGRTTTSSYDAADQLTGISYSDGATPAVGYSYDADGRRTRMTDGTGATSYNYDSLNRLTSSTNGAGATVGYAYDLMGRPTALTYPNGKTVSRGYDDAGRLTSVGDWLGHTTTFGYDPDANLTGQSYPNGVQTAATFNNADQLTGITHKTAAATLAGFAYTRDNLGQLTSTTPTGVPGAAESYGYTQLSQLASVNSSAYGYDAADNLTTVANGATQAFDAANQLTGSTTTGGGGATSLAADQTVSADQTTGASTIVSPTMTTTAGDELLIAFVSADGPTTPTQKVSTVTGGDLTWTLAARANQTLGTAEIWQAHAASTISGKITAKLAKIGYHGSMTVASFTGAAGTVTATATAAARTTHPTANLTTTKNGSVVWAAGHDWDRSKARTADPGQTIVHQLADRTVHDTYWTQRTTTPVAAAGTTVAIGASAPARDRWQLAAVEIAPAGTGSSTDGSVAYSYDSRGNRTSVTPADGPANVLTYDQANRLTAYGAIATYTYNGDGLRMSKTVRGTTTAFAWDLSGSLPLLLTDGADAYLYGPGGQPIEKITGSTATYLHQDQQGSIRLLTDTTGAVIGTYTYDPYGKVTGHTGTATSSLQYDGQYADGETGYEYLRARYYDPATGQFLTRDPSEVLTSQPYQYADNNPFNEMDPSGYFGALLGGLIGAVTGAVVGGVTYAIAPPGGKITPRGLFAATIGGAAGGAITGACDGATLLVTVCGAAGGFVGEYVTEVVGGESVDGYQLALSAAAGGAFGYLGKTFDPFPQRGFEPYLIKNLWNPGKNALRRYGSDLVVGASQEITKHFFRSTPAC